jgi:lipopolysaccharide/colanic/teichoic acid biosynthesis glycosyltransferase
MKIPEQADNYVATDIKIAKRILDIVCAAIALTVTAVLLPFIALAIKCESKGPIFFSQTRIGLCTERYAAVFSMIKFRTMGVNAEKNGAQWASENDNRITRIGQFLRKTRLDELPQFINVLKGEMSVVGPRPERPVFYAKLEHDIPLYSERTYGLKPGITGLAQVNQGYDTCIDDVRSKLLYDYSYSLSLSDFKAWLRMDFAVLYRTVMVCVLQKGR